MTTPDPAASSGPATFQQLQSGTTAGSGPTPDPTATGLAPDGTTVTSPAGSSPDEFSLGVYGGMSLDFGDLPSLTGPGGLISGATATGNQIVAQFAAMTDSGSIAQIQNALYQGGFYGKTGTPETYGVVTPGDVKAFAGAVKFTGQQQQAGDSTATLSNTIINSAKAGQIAGITAAANLRTSEKTAVVKQRYSTGELEQIANAAFLKDTGHNATHAQQAAFAASYQAMYAGMARVAAQSALTQKYGTGISAGQEGQDKEFESSIGAPTNPEVVHGLSAGQATGTGPGQVPDENSFGDETQQLDSVAAQVAAQQVPPVAPPGGGSVNAPEDPSTAAENFAQNTDPQGAGAHSVAGQFNNFLSLLAGNFGGGVPGG